MAKTREILMVAALVALYLCLIAVMPEMSSRNDNIQDFSSKVRIPVMNDSGVAEMVDVKIRLISGSGKILIDIRDSYMDDYNSQPAVKDAAIAAEKITGINPEDYDLIISIDGDGAAIKGDSFGASIAVGIAAAVDKRRIDPSVTITGAVNPDGSISRVDKIFEKAQASEAAGFETFLVPRGSIILQKYTEKKICDNQDNCSASIKREEINISKEAGINLIEVDNLNDAIIWMLK